MGTRNYNWLVETLEREVPIDAGGASLHQKNRNTTFSISKAGVEWPCYRNHMDTRYPAMLEGPNQGTRGMRYVKYLEAYYGTKTHAM
jgi:hypothetical protein